MPNYQDEVKHKTEGVVGTVIATYLKSTIARQISHSGAMHLYPQKIPSTIVPVTKRGTWNNPLSYDHEHGWTSDTFELDTRDSGPEQFIWIVSPGSTLADWTYLAVRLVTLPLTKDMLLEGNLTGNLKVSSETMYMNPHPMMTMYVLKGNTDELRGILIQDYLDPTEFPPYGLLEIPLDIPLLPVQAVARDRIVLELGWQCQAWGSPNWINIVHGRNLTNGPSWFELPYTYNTPEMIDTKYLDVRLDDHVKYETPDVNWETIHEVDE